MTQAARWVIAAGAPLLWAVGLPVVQELFRPRQNPVAGSATLRINGGGQSHAVNGVGDQVGRTYAASCVPGDSAISAPPEFSI
jgi:hypothetical protein